MKKAISVIAALTLVIGMLCVPAFAVDSATVYVTIANGALVLTQQPIEVTDIDGDGALTVNDALYLAHESGYTGGAAAGYASAVGDYGLALNKLWGVENGGSYSYYVNNTSAANLADTVKDGDYINAFVYTDTAAFSDTYCYFNTNIASAGQITLTLSAAGYDDNWNPIVKPVEGAEITIDGITTGIFTDANGSVTFTADSGVISAASTTATLVPPVCVIASAVAAPQTGDSATAFTALIGLVSLSAIIILRKKAAHE